MWSRFVPWPLTALLLAGGTTLPAIAAEPEVPAKAAPSSNPAWPPHELGRLIVKNYSPREFVGNAQVWDTAEDDDGVLYVGNLPGLATFDGAVWRRVSIRTPIDSAHVVVRGPDGKIYVGGSGFFGRLKPVGDGRHEFVSLTETLPEKDRNFGVMEDACVHAGAIYMTASERTLVWRDGKLAVFHENRLPMYVVGDELYIIRKGQPLARVEDGKLVDAGKLGVPDTTGFWPVGTAPDGSLLLFANSEKGLHALRGGQLALWPNETAEGLKAKLVRKTWQLRDGTLVILTSQGLFFLGTDGRLLARLSETTGLQNQRIESLSPARDGGLWLGSSNGLSHVSWPPAFTLFNSANGLPSSSIRDVRRSGGKIYAASVQGIYRLKPTEWPANMARFERMAADDVHVLVESEAGLLAGGTGLLMLTPEDWKVVFPLKTAVFSILPSRHDPSLVWLGLRDGVQAVRRTAEGWSDAGRLPLALDNVRALVELPDGRIWGCVPGKGVFRFTPGSGPEAKAPGESAHVERFFGTPGAPAVSRVAAWGGEPIFTAAEGERTAFRFDESTRQFQPWPGLDPLPAGQTIAGNILGSDNPAHLWLRRTFTTNEEKIIYRVARDGGVQALPQSLHESINTVLRFFEETGPSGRVLWLAGTDGLMRVEVDRAFPPPVPFRALVRSRGGRVPPGAVLPFTQGTLDFDYVAPRYSPNYPLSYQTRLVGDDTAWSEWTTDRRRTFTHLYEGAYRFEVQARDIDGHLSAPATLAFNILPPWWRTWWAYGGYAAMLGLTIYGSVRLRTRALQKKNEQLEKVVATRTEDLRRQNAELARLHKLELDEKITARLAAEKAQLDVLRYQLNPHFLFNSLTSIRSQIPPALGSARDTLDRLADFCRLTLTGRKAEERTTVGEEVAMLRAYLDIEQTRMGELLSVEFDVDHTLDGLMMPRLLLLPLVENGLKYGQATSEDTLALKISAQRAPGGGEGVVFEISNTGTWVERGSRPGIPSTGIGHENLRERLRRHYPDAFAFAHSAVDGWVHVRLELKTVAQPS